ncbi:hypothetical protein [Hirschia litorea]|uniref:DUF11 domain-containing protein n=1 Tax=Hirschia litorea TaxID=1199156 RepID=A0ABW2IP77_9PROT
MKHFILPLIISMAAITQPALAQKFEAEQTVEKQVITTDENGNTVESYEEAIAVAPGDIVRYSLDYKNNLAQPADGVEFVIPVPAQTIFVAGSATEIGAATTSYSMDGAESFTADNNVSNDQPDAITHVKWTFTQAVAPTEAGKLSFLAQLQ